MRVLEKNFKKGIVKVVPRTLDDLWHLYNIVHKGDLVYARTTRETKVEGEYSRPQKGKRVSVVIGVRVEGVVWDRSLNRLRVHGRICEAPEDVAGRSAHHTLNIAVNSPLTIVKDRWMKHEVDRLERARHFETPPVIVVSIDSDEYCIAMIREYGVDLMAEGRASLPGKLEAEKRTAAILRYFQEVLNALKAIWQKNHFPIVVIGVGFVKNQFANFLRGEASEPAEAVVDVKSVNSSGLVGVQEALRSGIFDTAVKHVRVAEETRVVEELLSRLGANRSDVAYGLEQVEKADGFGAVETLLVADFAIRDASDEVRLGLEGLMRGVEKKGGKVVVVSVEHEAGQKLLGLGGVAALLRFPVS